MILMGADSHYVLFVSPQFQVNMKLSGADGPGTRFMTEVGIMFRNEEFFFNTTSFQSASYHEELGQRLDQVGGQLLG